ncbi:MAG: phosphatidate cytidylyltransferase [Bdellovibrionales bacterium]|nr:phosphatidate cytidylyltransferase [Bdellovibrionales bacterium]
MLIRAITALVGIGGIIATWVLFKETGLLALAALVSLVTCIEFSMLLEKGHSVMRVFFVFVCYSFYLAFTFFSQSFLVFLICFLLVAAYFILFSKDNISARMVKLASWMMGIIYCGSLPGTVSLGVLKFGAKFFTALLILSFGTDTFAYLGGRLLGRTPLAPDISPNKTLEGSFIGLVGGSALGFYYLYQNHFAKNLALLAVCCVLTSIATQLGDLFESMIKRYSGVKDSGKMMPGHGGVLDRIDGLLFAAPILFMWLLYFQG